MHIPASDAKHQFADLLDRVAQGEEVTITRHGKPVARLVPADQPRAPEQARAALQRLRDRAAALNAGPFNWQEWRSARDDGRE